MNHSKQCLHQSGGLERLVEVLLPFCFLRSEAKVLPLPAKKALGTDKIMTSHDLHNTPGKRKRASFVEDNELHLTEFKHHKGISNVAEVQEQCDP